VALDSNYPWGWDGTGQEVLILNKVRYIAGNTLLANALGSLCLKVVYILQVVVGCVGNSREYFPQALLLPHSFGFSDGFGRWGNEKYQDYIVLL
jgi:hypothetical protein